MFAGGVYPTVGASGGVFGLLLAYGMYFPHNRIMLLFPPIPMPARVFVVLYAVIELFLGVTGSQEGVAHFAHLGGMIGGYPAAALLAQRGSPSVALMSPMLTARSVERLTIGAACVNHSSNAFHSTSYRPPTIGKVLARFARRRLRASIRAAVGRRADPSHCHAHGGAQ